ncbi:cytochrome P450 [Williamsia maris]|uniref:cytochrome P450 n=1 Tax=Williamsia maris TaxID=72806 RepID=UPI0020A43EE0|nr:cytochrome P450 [Williamsia maris]
MTSSLHVDGASPGVLRPFWEADLPTRLAAFADLRARPDLPFHEMDSGGQGFWSVTSYADAVAVTKDPATYSNARGFSLDDMSRQLLETMASIIGMDDPKHKQQRKLVQGAFTMRAIAALTDNVASLSDVIVDELRDLGEFDFVDAVASKLPLQVICDLLSIPASDRPHLRVLVDRVLGVSDPSFGGPQQGVEAVIELFGYAIELGKERQATPGDDLTSLLMSAEVDGQRLTPTEFGSFLILMIAAGNDTTRTGLAWAIHLLSEHPEQQRMLAADFDGHQANAIEEILRWSSPSCTCAEPRRATPRSATSRWPRATRSSSGISPPIAIRRCSRTPTPSTSPGTTRASR